MNKLRFDKEGKLILPEPIKEDKEKINRIKEEKKKFTKKLILKYLGSEKEGFIRCEFEINTPKELEEIKKKMFEIRNWADKKVETNARIWFEKIDEGYKLIISGRGNDKRCEWCRSFRTALDTSLFDSKIAVYQKDFCKFDKNSGYQKLKSLGTT